MPGRSARRALFGLLTLVLTIALVECLSFVGSWLVSGRRFSWEAHQARRESLAGLDAGVEQEDRTTADRTGDPSEQGEFVIHPFLGYVTDPRSRAGVSDFGFRGDLPDAPLGVPAEGQVVVGLFGGSVAARTSGRAQRILREGIQQVPRYRGTKCVIHTMAWAGYKQPQQLMVLAYFLALGARFDLVVNLDGFNEVAMPTADNLPQGVYPFYPRNWYGLVHDTPDRDTLVEIARIEEVRERRRGWARFFSAPLLRLSVATNLVWELGDDRLERRIAALQLGLQRRQAQCREALPYRVTGPRFEAASEDAAYHEMSRVWARSSLAMAQLCAANGIEYFQFLQPNQYVPGSKPMTRGEQRVALLDDHPYRKGVEAGYPHLRREGEKLRDRGVRFEDLTMVFATVEQPLYSDTCCHLNQEGYELLAEAMVASIQKELGTSPGGETRPRSSPME